MTEPIRVLVVDDHAIVREGVRTVLDDAATFRIVGEGGSAAAAVALSHELRPDVLILDISMPGGSGLHAVSQVLDRSPSTRILILSVHDDAEYIRESMRAGAHGYLRKDSPPEDVRAAVRSVHAGEAFFSPVITSRIAASLIEPHQDPEAEPGPDTLTAREREVLIGVSQGLANKEIAAALGISRRTVEVHRESLTRKLGIRSVAGLTRYCLKHGLIVG
ncbi:MAG TPA: response regulator transcription factor [Gemmatimonadaceae bacterium]